MTAAAVFDFLNLATKHRNEDENSVADNGTNNPSQKECKDLIVRRANLNDTPSMETLFWQNVWCQHVYAQTNPIDFVSSSGINVVVEELNTNRVVGFVSYDVHPKLDEIPAGEWKEWFVRTLQVTTNYPAMTTLFQTMVISAEEENVPVIQTALTWLFKELEYLEHVFHITRKNDQSTNFLWYAGLSPVSLSGDHQVYEVLRAKVAPRLVGRQARLQDYDDIVPMLKHQRQHQKFVEQLGEHYLAKIIQDTSGRFYTAAVESNNVAVGAVVTCTDTDLNELHRNFELDIYHGLRRHSHNDVLNYRSQLTSVSAHKSSTGSTSRSVQSDKSYKGKHTDQSSHSLTQRGVTQPDSLNCSVADDQLSSITASDETSAQLACKPDTHNKTTLKEGVSSSLAYKTCTINTISHNSQQSSSIKSGPLLKYIWRRKKVAQTTPKHPETSIEDDVKHKDKENISVYTGHPDAVEITLFAIDKQYEHRCADLLEQVFNHYQEISYIIMRRAPSERQSPLSKLFNRVPRRSNSYNEDLYVFHRAALAPCITIRRGQLSDMPKIRHLIKYTEQANELLDTLRFTLMDELIEEVYTVQSHDEIIGFVQVDHHNDIDAMQAHYDIEEYIPCITIDQGKTIVNISTFMLNPAFHRFQRQVLGELMRVTGYSALVHSFRPAAARDQPLALSSMWPVKWRRQIDYSAASLGNNMPYERFTKVPRRTSLFITSPSWVHRKRTDITSRILVVGGGDVGLSILERLAFSKQLNFVSLTLIDPNGFRGEKHSSEIAKQMVPSTENFQHDRLLTIWLRMYVDIIEDTLVGIDRDRKSVQLRSGLNLFYDTLVLACGKQFQLPCMETQQRTCHPYRMIKLASHCDTTPSNVFVVNNESEAERALQEISRYALTAEPYRKFVIIGKNLEALVCLETLLNFGVDYDSIALVFPRQHDGNKLKPIVHDPVVEGAVFKKILWRKHRIAVYENFNVLDFKIDRDNNLVTQLLITDGKPIAAVHSILCHAVFHYERREIGAEIRTAVEKASLLMDGHMVIDSKCFTNDRSIRAVGAMTKYARKYHADWTNQGCYNPHEVGKYLATLICEEYGEIPSNGCQDIERLQTAVNRHKNIDQSVLTPQFRKPLVTKFSLPEGYTLLEVRHPPRHPGPEPKPTIISTGDPFHGPESSGYMSIEIGPWRNIQKLVCYSKNKIDVDHMIGIYDMHEILLNNLVARYKNNLINDLYRFLREPWATMLFHDRFRELLTCARVITQQCHREDGTSLEEYIEDAVYRYTQVSDPTELSILKDFRRCYGVERVEGLILQYLDNHSYHLPMYARGGTAQQLQEDVEEVIRTANRTILTSKRPIYCQLGLKEI